MVVVHETAQTLLLLELRQLQLAKHALRDLVEHLYLNYEQLLLILDFDGHMLRLGDKLLQVGYESSMMSNSIRVHFEQFQGESIALLIDEGDLNDFEDLDELFDGEFLVGLGECEFDEIQE